MKPPVSFVIWDIPYQLQKKVYLAAGRWTFIWSTWSPVISTFLTDFLPVRNLPTKKKRTTFFSSFFFSTTGKKRKYKHDETLQYGFQEGTTESMVANAYSTCLFWGEINKKTLLNTRRSHSPSFYCMHPNDYQQKVLCNDWTQFDKKLIRS